MSEELRKRINDGGFLPLALTIDPLQKILVDIMDLIQKNQAQIKDLNDVVNNKAENSLLQQLGEKVDNNNREINDRVNDLSNKVDEKEKDLNNKISDLDNRLGNEIKDINDECDLLKAAVDDNQNRIQDVSDRLDSELKKIKDDIANANEKIGDHEERIKALENSSSAGEKSRKSSSVKGGDGDGLGSGRGLDGSDGASKSGLDGRSRELGGSGGKSRSGIPGEVSDLDLDEIKRLLGELSDKVNEHGGVLKDHGNKLDEHHGILKDHGHKLDEHQGILREHGNKLDEHQRDIDELKNRVNNLLKNVTNAAPIDSVAASADGSVDLTPIINNIKAIVVRCDDNEAKTSANERDIDDLRRRLDNLGDLSNAFPGSIRDGSRVSGDGQGSNMYGSGSGMHGDGSNMYGDGSNTHGDGSQGSHGGLDATGSRGSDGQGQNAQGRPGSGKHGHGSHGSKSRKSSGGSGASGSRGADGQGRNGQGHYGDGEYGKNGSGYAPRPPQSGPSSQNRRGPELSNLDPLPALMPQDPIEAIKALKQELMKLTDKVGNNEANLAKDNRDLRDQVAKLTRDVNDRPDKQLIERLFEKFKSSMNDLANMVKNGQPSSHEPGTKFATENDVKRLESFIKQLVQEQDEAAAARKCVKCLSCGQGYRQCTGSITDAETATILGAAPISHVVPDQKPCFVYGSDNELYYSSSTKGKTFCSPRKSANAASPPHQPNPQPLKQ